MPLQSWQKTQMMSRWLQHQREPEGFFDAMLEMTCRALEVPAAMISTVNETRHQLNASYGLSCSITSMGEIPISHSICRHVVAMGRPLVVQDALSHPLVSTSPTVREFGLAAYLGEPLHDPAGDAFGCFSVMDFIARDWTETQRRMMSINAMIIERALTWPDGPGFA